MALADRLYLAGETDRALEIYYAAVARGAAVERQEAMWKVSRIQYDQGEHAAASQNAQAFLGTSPDGVQERQALLLLGYSEMARGRNRTAEDAFESYVETAGPALPYAQLQLAELASRRGDNDEAIGLANDALAADLPDGPRSAGLFALARYREADGDRAGALATYETLAANGETSSDRAEALWNLAAVARELRNEAREQTALRDLIVSYPTHDRALEALNGASPAGAAERAYVLFRHRANDDATAAYQPLAADANPVVSGEAHYYLGILAERGGDPGLALNEYSASIASLTGTSSSLLGDAHWDRGLVFEASGRLDEAALDFAAVADVTAGHPNAAEGLFRAGLIRYRQGLPADATILLSRYSQVAGGEAPRAEFWLAQAALAQGDFFGQAQHLEAAVDSGPLTYYGLRSRAILDQETPDGDPLAVEVEVPDWASLEAWLVARYGAEDPAKWQSFAVTPAWQRGLELLDAALFAPGFEEIAPMADAAGDPWTRYRIARAMYEAGRIRLAARAAQPLMGGAAETPPALLGLVYPARFAAQANTAAAIEGVSPFLLLALVRQESFFDETAVSAVGALGLTQVMPATAAEIAAGLEIADFKDGDLLSPETSLRFGAHYLANQLQGFGGNVHAALAAYNGGPGNAGRWAEASGGDPDLLLEAIDFSETRLYVEVVLQNYAIYLYMYGDADHASLPLP
ncbi:MAG TPA: transglycosylase SLT domain-containing protein [Dehalococcoidia bacterium]|nr:transglycosylase SLT domain-containing protein [Dehalococcoidia bacterium]